MSKSSDSTPHVDGDTHNLPPDTPLIHHDEATLINASKTSQSFISTVAYFMAIHFLLAFAEIIVIAPFISLFEISLCKSYYYTDSMSPGESRCKIPAIQGPLATIRGWKATFDMLPALLVAVPFGKWGDRRGRRGVLALAVLGVLVSWAWAFTVCANPQTFSLRWIWLSSIPLFCGGGLNAASSYMWAFAADSIPEERRSHAFYLIFSAFYIAELVASSLASITMETSPWIACIFGVWSLLICLFLIWIRHDPVGAKSSTQQVGNVASVEGRYGDNFSQECLDLNQIPTVTRFKTAFCNRNIQLIIPVFLVGILRYTSLNVLIQYASVRFGLKLGTGARFYTETAIINIALFLFLVPQTTLLLREKYGVRPQVIDVTLVRASLCILCLGSLAIGLAPSAKTLPIGVALFAAGFGSRVSALSLLSYWVSDDAKAGFYAAIVVLESLGHAIGEPTMQHIFAAALVLPPFWQATPFFVAAGAYGMVAISSSFIRTEDNGTKASEPENGSNID